PCDAAMSGVSKVKRYCSAGPLGTQLLFRAASTSLSGPLASTLCAQTSKRGTHPLRLQRWHRLLAPELPRCQARAFYERLELHVRDGRMQPARAETAVRPGDHIVAPDHRGVVADALRHQLRVLDRIGVVADDTRDEDLARRQLDVLPEV